MVETHTRILGIAPYDGMRTAMEQAAQAYPNVELEVYTGDLEEGQAIVQRMAPNSYDCIISRGGTATLIRQVTDLPVVDIRVTAQELGVTQHCRLLVVSGVELLSDMLA